MNIEKMKIEIWSDVMCPFCYIGKRHLEKALSTFPGKENIEIVWKSFQLNPNLSETVDSSQNSYKYIANSKGITLEQSKAMHQNVVDMGKKANLDFNFDKALISNSLKAHRMLQMAKTKNLGDQTKEVLLKAYFMEGKNMSDEQTLIDLGTSVGLNENDIKASLTDPEFYNLVQRDIQESQQIGVQGVPFFVFDRKYAISGAQPVENFIQTIEQSYAEWREKNETSGLKVNEGPSCAPDRNCE
jgi:protein disulfide-isomerase